MTKKNSSRRTISLYPGKNTRLDNALEAMEDEISKETISFNEVASDIRRSLIHEYLPLYFSKINPSPTDFEISAFRAISYYEAKIRFLKMLVSKEVGDSLTEQSLEMKSGDSEMKSGDSEMKSGDPEDKVYGDNTDEEDESTRFSLSIFDVSDSGDD